MTDKKVPKSQKVSDKVNDKVKEQAKNCKIPLTYTRNDKRYKKNRKSSFKTN